MYKSSSKDKISSSKIPYFPLSFSIFHYLPLSSLKSFILSATLLLLPLFFLPVTQEYFTTAKFYLLSFSTLILLLISGIEIFLHKKSDIKLNITDLVLIFFLLAVFLSTLFQSPNKIQALLNPNFGFILFLSLTIFIYYLRKSELIILKYLTLSAYLLILVNLIFFFQPFKYLSLPFELQFLKNRFFTPIGSQTNLATFLAFTLLTQIINLNILLKDLKKITKHHLAQFTPLVFILTGFLFTLYSFSQSKIDQSPTFITSWDSFIEILKNPVSALFGTGIDNFSDTSRSALLHIATESGLLGFLSFLLILISSFRIGLRQDKILLLPLMFTTAVLIFFPPSLLVFLLFYLSLTIYDSKSSSVLKLDKNHAKNFYPFFSLLLIMFSLTLVFLLSRAFYAEYLFKKSINSLAGKNQKNLYDYQRRAVLVNPFIERFHLNFSQTNLLLANSLRQKPGELSDAENELLIEAGKTALLEGNKALLLNPQKASNWDNLGLITKNLNGVFAGMPAHTIYIYQRAVLLDPFNPSYRYNLALAYYQNKQYQKAEQEMEKIVNLFDKDKNKAQYKIAVKSLEDVKNKKVPIIQDLSVSKTATAEFNLNFKDLELPDRN